MSQSKSTGDNPYSAKLTHSELHVLKAPGEKGKVVAFKRWQKQMYEFVSTIFPNESIVIMLQEYELREAEDANTVYTADNDPTGKLKIMQQARFKAFALKAVEQEERMSKIFALIMNHISLESEQLVRVDLVRHYRTICAERLEEITTNTAWNQERDVDTEEAKEVPEPYTDADDRTAYPNGYYEFFRLTVRDPLELMKSLVRTHCHQSGYDALRDKQEALNEYTKVRMFKTEDLHSYHQRFNVAVEGLRLADQLHWGDEDLAYEFINRLNQQFDDFKSRLAYDSDRGISRYPSTVERAYEEAAKHMARVKDFATKKERNSQSSATSAATGDPPTEMSFGAQTKDSAKDAKAKAKSGKSGKSPSATSTPAPAAAATAGAGAGAGAQTKIPKTECKLCAKLGKRGMMHYLESCPTFNVLPDLQKKGALLCVEVNHNPNAGILDSGASTHMSGNPALVTNIVPNGEGTRIGGVIGEDFCPQSKATLGPFGEAYFDPAINATLISMGLVESMGKIVHKKKAKIVFINGRKFIFKKRDNLYVCDLSELTGQPSQEVAFVSTVADNEAQFTQRQVADAKEADQFVRRMGYPSTTALNNAINTGVMTNVPVTTTDVSRALRLYGNVPSLKGKSTTPTPTNMGDFTNPIDNSSDRVPQTLHLDCMHVMDNDFLVSFATPLGLLSVEHLPSKTTPVYAAKLKNIIQGFSRVGFSVEAVSSDGELAISNAALAVGLRVDVVATGRHNSVVERQIRQIKERCRTIIHGLRFKCREGLIKYLCKFVVSRINMMPSSSDYVLRPQIPSREKLLGRKTDAKRDVSFEFGEYVQVFNNHNKAMNSMASRTIDAIALYPANDLNGSGYFLSLSSRKVFRANAWKPQPMSESVIARLESLGRIIGDNEVAELPMAEPDQEIAGVHVMPAQPAAAPVVNPVPAPEDAPAPEVDVMPPVQPVVPDVQQADPIPGVVEPAIDVVQPAGEDPIPGVDDEQPDYSGQPVVSTYNLRSRSAEVTEATDLPDTGRTLRPRDQLQLPARFKESAYHLSVKKSEKLFGAEATMTSLNGEVDNLLNHDTIEPVYFKDMTSEQKKGTIRSSVFLKDKRDSQNNLVKLKSRLVAGGDRQDRSLYSKEDTTSPTVSTTSLLGILALSAKERRHLTVVDVGSAYLNADMQGPDVFMMIEPKLATIFVSQCPDYEKYLHDGKLYVKLKKSLYGCIQSAKLWYDEVSAALREFGFTPNGLDICVFNQVIDGVQITVTVHVDDMLIATKNQKLADELVEKLKKRYKTITVKRGKQLEYLGLNIMVNDDGTLDVDMKRYLDDIVSDTETTDTAASPAAGNLFEVRELEPLSSDAADNFRTTVARLLFVGTHTRPDLMLALAFLTSRAQAPTLDDQRKLNRLLKYVNGTRHLKLRLSSSDSPTVTAFVDSSYGVHPDGKGHTGGVLTLGQGAIHVRSTRQKIVARSSTEAELIGLTDYSSHVLHMREFLLEQGYEVGPAQIFHDNKSTLAMINRGKHSGERTKHISMRYFFLKDRVSNNEIRLEYLPTEDMVADQLTKPLTGKQFCRLRDLLLGTQDVTAGVCCRPNHSLTHTESV
jgi:hypothetical protein